MTMRDQIREILETFASGVTCDDVEVLTGISHQTASSALWALRQAGIVVDSGRTAATRTGATAVVWTIPSLLPMVERVGVR